MWVEQEDNTFYYIDGHVKVYSLARKESWGKKISGLIGLPDDELGKYAEGLPYLVVTGSR